MGLGVADSPLAQAAAQRSASQVPRVGVRGVESRRFETGGADNYHGYRVIRLASK